MKVEYLSPDELIPYAKNAKQHPPKQVDQIANSIKRFGWQQPIVVDKKKVVIIGHGRRDKLHLPSASVLFRHSSLQPFFPIKGKQRIQLDLSAL